ncbi:MULTISPECIES: cytochrome c oxidase subunit 2A [Psychrobacillus]|uniref:Cytochrome c oxidase subunit 2A n=1 Tax=Psychrobacillus soli TaxID=1543965 RepID=A0A544TD33_9BACI|nr:cytochrome c oxidase subunit 2A [Psychrobacillus soli]TQR15341.1 cytochrome c oxidase subunit 2A [Psychrobacillus soli]
MSKKREKEPDLKGTLYSVGFLGIFILVTWFMAFYLFIDRF